MHFSLQDRPGEAECLRKAVERSKLYILQISAEWSLLYWNCGINATLDKEFVKPDTGDHLAVLPVTWTNVKRPSI